MRFKFLLFFVISINLYAQEEDQVTKHFKDQGYPMATSTVMPMPSTTSQTIPNISEAELNAYPIEKIKMPELDTTYSYTTTGIKKQSKNQLGSYRLSYYDKQKIEQEIEEDFLKNISSDNSYLEETKRNATSNSRLNTTEYVSPEEIKETNRILNSSTVKDQKKNDNFYLKLALYITMPLVIVLAILLYRKI